MVNPIKLLTLFFIFIIFYVIIIVYCKSNYTDNDRNEYIKHGRKELN